MSDIGVQSEAIHERAHEALQDAHLQEAYRSSTLRLYTHRLKAIGEVPGFESLRERGRALKREVMDHLDYYLEQFADNVERQGGKVHWARTAEEACAIVKEIVKNAGAKEVFRIMWAEGGEADAIIEAKGLKQVSDSGAIEKIVDDILSANADKVAEYRSGKDKLFGFFVGQVMKASKGKANPALVNELLKKKLSDG